AHGLRPPLRLYRDGPRRGRLARRVDGRLGDGGDGRGAHLRDGDQPRRRPRHRRAQSAHRRAAPAHGHAPRRRAQAPRGGGRRAHRGAPEPRAHRRGARSPRMVDRARVPLLGRLGRGRGAPGLRALAGERAGPLASRRRLLQRQRLHRADRPRLRRRRPLAMTAARRSRMTQSDLVRAMFTRIARRYDLMNSLMTGGRHYAWRAVVARAAAVAEMRRVTMPGGVVTALEITRPGVPGWDVVFGLYFNRLVPLIGALVAGERAAYTYLPQSVERFVTPAELARLMEGVGLREVQYRRLGLGTIALHVASA